MLLSTPEHSQGQHRLGVPPALTPRHHGDRAEGPRATGLSPTSPHVSGSTAHMGGCGAAFSLPLLTTPRTRAGQPDPCFYRSEELQQL